MSGFLPNYTIEVARREQAEIENALFDGFPSSLGRSGHKRGVYRVVARRLQYSDHGQGLRRRHGLPGETGSVFRQWGLLVDWGMYRNRDVPKIEQPTPASEP